MRGIQINGEFSLRVTRLLAGVLAGVTTLTMFAGCAGQQIQALEPKLELRDAAKQLGEAQRAGFTIKINGSADDLIAAAALTDSGAGAGADEKILRQLFNSSVTIAYDKAGEGTEDDRASISATVDGVTGTEVRYVDKTVFLRAPIADLAAKFGASADEVKALSGQTAGGPAGLDAFFDGGWVSVDSAALGDLAEAGAGVEAPDLEEEKALTEFSTSATNLLEGADLVRDENDDTHLVATTSTTKAYAELQRLVTAVDKDLAPELGTDAPADKPIALDLWIVDGKLTAAEINLLQFADGATGRVALRLEVTTGAEIAAPEGATKLDPQQLQGPASVQPYLESGELPVPAATS
ncbi:hypothetical protein AMIS_41940 [Actinoplanes missouriensis 431]|uniref:Lipoprotein n=1 Tax=Actinoplanes missouriensis (strain ATCC 14538 / DSM 43046 / CBS 188.64 / JCM 3121 / NBRC 102363 / NCIMB 12654 / NRRL B-3342 / UNCC 431) TaxID=512565 RepID=I0H8S7_ACTM4|nr:hypothetical protein AMIS_41940 [Actinoplanes missouriensis 431]